MSLRFVAGDITEQHVDVIVTAANAELVGGGGVDGAVHRACGPQLYDALRPFGGCPTGSAVITPAFALTRVRYIVHAVGPIYRDGLSGEPELLASAYTRSLELAANAGCASIAFPAISAGVYGYPLDDAARIAVTTVRRTLEHTPTLTDVRFVLFSDQALEAFRSVS